MKKRRKMMKLRTIGVVSLLWEPPSGSSWNQERGRWNNGEKERERTQRKVINADILMYIDVEKSSQEGDKIQAVGTTDDYTIRYTKELRFI